jgi:hypothetical protein
MPEIRLKRTYNGFTTPTINPACETREERRVERGSEGVG